MAWQGMHIRSQGVLLDAKLPAAPLEHASVTVLRIPESFAKQRPRPRNPPPFVPCALCGRCRRDDGMGSSADTYCK